MNPNNEGYYLQDYVNYGKYLYAKTGETLYRSGDHGGTWSKIILPVSEFTEFSLDGGKGDTLFLSFFGQFAGGQYFSLNAGGDWFKGSESIRSVNNLIWNNKAMFGTKTETYQVEKLYKERQVVLRSDNFGQTWEASSIGLDTTIYIRSLIQGESDETFYLLGYTPDEKYIIYKSNDKGLSWNLVNVNYNGDFSIISDLKFHDNSLYLAHVVGILRSNDGGESWVSFDAGLPEVSYGAFAFRDDEIYFGTYGYGIWKASTIPLGLNECNKSSNDILIYPNPASDYANVKSINGSGVITILNMQGGTIKEINTEPGNMFTRVQISDIRAGVYILKYESDGKSFSERLVIVR